MSAKTGVSNKKMMQAVMVGLLTIAIILAGTFAWTSFTQQALNIFEGWTNPDVNLHDDFDEPNKDVYVENSGQRPLYVRVKFDEFMEIDGKAVANVEGSGRDDVEHWNYHSYMGDYNANICDMETHQYYEWVMGRSGAVASPALPADPDLGRKYYLSAPYSHRALFDADGYQLAEPQTIAYDISLVDSDQVRYGVDDNYLPAEMQSPKEAYDRIYAIFDELYVEDAAYTQPATTSYTKFVPTATSTNVEYVDYLYSIIDKPTSTATQKADAQIELDKFQRAKNLGYWDLPYTLNDLPDGSYYMSPLSTRTGAAATGTSVDFDPAMHITPADDPVFVPIKRTLQTATVYTMAQWIAAGTPIGNFWVVDKDGWCYWANVLLPTQATGLLLSEVILNELSPPNGVWWYGINITLQAATADDIGKFYTTTDPDTSLEIANITEQGKMVLNAVSGKHVFGSQAPTDLTKPIYTYESFGDNVYRLMTSDGTRTTYGPRFVYTGETGTTAAAMKAIYDTFTPLYTDSSTYKVGATFWKAISKSPTITWKQFTVVDADPNDDGHNTGIIEGANGKHYIKVQYDTNKTAWLAVGPNGEFNALEANTSNKFGLVALGGTAASLVSENDDQLIWTEADKPGTSSDRYQESIPANTVKLGDTFTADSIDWVVIGLKDSTDQAIVSDQALVISQYVLEAEIVSAGAISATLAGANAFGKYDDTKLAELKAANGGTAIEPTALTVGEALEYFLKNSDRIATTDSGTAATPWWLENGYVNDKGEPMGEPTIADDAKFGLRVAFWMDVDYVNAILYPPATP